MHFLISRIFKSKHFFRSRSKRIAARSLHHNRRSKTFRNASILAHKIDQATIIIHCTDPTIRHRDFQGLHGFENTNRLIVNRLHRDPSARIILVLNVNYCHFFDLFI